jgi:hypothetical protein
VTWDLVQATNRARVLQDRFGIEAARLRDTPTGNDMSEKDKGGLGNRPSPQPQPGKGQPDHKPGDDQPNDPAKTPPDMGNDDVAR